MSRRRPTAMGSSNVRLVRGVRVAPPKRVMDLPGRQGVRLGLTCDGRPGRDCGKLLITFGQSTPPRSYEEVIIHGEISARLTVNDGPEVLDLDLECPACGALSVLVPVRVVIAALTAMLEKDKRALRVSCSLLAAQPL